MKVYNYLFEVIFQLAENQELVAYQSEEYENSFILYISQKEKSSSFLPALEWPNHKPKLIGFNNKNEQIKLLKFMIDGLQFNAIAIKNEDNVLKCRNVLSPVLKIKSIYELKKSSNGLYKNHNLLKNDDWTWNINFLFLNLYDCDAQSPFCAFEMDLPKNNKYNKIILSMSNCLKNNLIDLLQIFTVLNVKNIEIRLFEIFRSNFFSSCTDDCRIHLSVNKLKVQSWSQTYLVESKFNDISLIWTTFDNPPYIYGEWMLIKISKIDAKNFTVTLCGNEYEEPAKDAVDSLLIKEKQLYAVFKTKDISKVDVKFVNIISYFANLKSLNSYEVVIRYDCPKREIVRNLDLLPRSANIVISLYKEHFKIAYRLDFWNVVLSFPSLTFRINGKSRTVFEWELDSDPFLSMIPCSIDNWKEIKLASLISLIVSELLHSASSSSPESK